MEDYTKKSKDELIDIINSFNSEKKTIQNGLSVEHQTILSSMNDIVFVFDSEQRFTYVNIPNNENLFLESNEFIGHKHHDVMPENMHQAFDVAFKKNRKGEHITFNYQLEVSKQTQYFTSSLSPIFVNKQFKGCVATVSDITNKKRSEQKLLKEKEFSQKILQASNAFIVGLDQNHMIKVFNKGAEDISGYKKDDVIGKDWFKLFFPENILDEMNTIWKQSWGTKYHSYKNVIKKKTGEERIISWQTTGISDSPNNKNHLLISIGEDITEQILTQQELKKSEEKFRSMFMNNSSVMLLIDFESGNIEYANNAAVDFYSYTNNQFTGMSIDKINTLPAHSIEERRSSVILKKQDIFIFKHRLKNKTVKTVEVTSSPIIINNKTMLFSVVKDITDKIKAEKKLIQSEEKFRLLADYTNDWEYWINKQGKYVYISPSCKQITGYTAKEITDNHNIFFNMIHSDHTEKVHAHFRYENNKNTLDFSTDFQIITKSGEIKWINHNCKPIFDDQGNYLGRRGNNRDITEEKNAKLKLQESESKFKNVFENSLIGFSITGIDGSLYTNKAFSDLLGYSQKELESINWQDITHPDDLEISNSVVQSLLNKTKTNARFEKRYIHKKGHTIFIENTVVLHFDDTGKAQYFISAINDQTEKKKAQKELKLSEQKFRNFFENNQAVMLEIDSKTRDIINCNKKAEEFYGYTKKELLRKNMTEINLISDTEIDSKIKTTINKGNLSSKFKQKLKNNDIRDVNTFVSKVIVQNKVHLFAIVYDITDSTKNKQELIKYKTQLEDTVKERTKELEEKNRKLEEYNQLFIGREFRIKELREKIKVLKQK